MPLGPLFAPIPFLAGVLPWRGYKDTSTVVCAPFFLLNLTSDGFSCPQPTTLLEPVEGGAPCVRDTQHMQSLDRCFLPLALNNLVPAASVPVRERGAQGKVPIALSK